MSPSSLTACLIGLSGFLFCSLESLDKYVHDYMIKKGMHKTAEIFRQEAGVSNDPVGTSASSLVFHLFVHLLILHKNNVFFNAPCVILLS